MRPSRTALLVVIAAVFPLIIADNGSKSAPAFFENENQPQLERQGPGANVASGANVPPAAGAGAGAAGAGAGPPGAGAAGAGTGIAGAAPAPLGSGAGAADPSSGTTSVASFWRPSSRPCPRPVFWPMEGQGKAPPVSLACDIFPVMYTSIADACIKEQAWDKDADMHFYFPICCRRWKQRGCM